MSDEKKAQITALANRISAELEKLAGKDDFQIPALAMASFRALKRLQQGGAEEHKAAQVWLRGMWDNLDIAVIQPAFHCRHCSKKQSKSAIANYVVLEGYFSGYGDISKELNNIERGAASRGFIPDKEVLEKLVEQLVILVLGVNALGGRLIG